MVYLDHLTPLVRLDYLVHLYHLIQLSDLIHLDYLDNLGHFPHNLDNLSKDMLDIGLFTTEGDSGVYRRVGVIKRYQ